MWLNVAAAMEAIDRSRRGGAIRTTLSGKSCVTYALNNTTLLGSPNTVSLASRAFGTCGRIEVSEVLKYVRKKTKQNQMLVLLHLIQFNVILCFVSAADEVAFRSRGCVLVGARFPVAKSAGKKKKNQVPKRPTDVLVLTLQRRTGFSV